MIVSVLIFLAVFIFTFNSTDNYHSSLPARQAAETVFRAAESYCSGMIHHENAGTVDGAYYFPLTRSDDLSGVVYDGSAADIEKYMKYIGYCGKDGYACVFFENGEPVQAYWCKREFPEITDYKFDPVNEINSDGYLYRKGIGGYPQITDHPPNYETAFIRAVIIAAAAGIFCAANRIYEYKHKKQ